MDSDEACLDFQRSVTPSNAISLFSSVALLHRVKLLGWTTVDALNWANEHPFPPYRLPTKLKGGTWSALAAAAHWLFGKGTSLSVDIRDISLNVKIDEIGNLSKGNSLENFILNNNQPGTYHYYSGITAYSTYRDSFATALLLGGISIVVEGELTRNADYSWKFEGSVDALPDTFNFEPRNERPWWAEAMVTTVRQLPGTDFQIDITDTLPINFSGN